MNLKIAEFLVKYRLWFFIASLAVIGYACSGFSRLVYIADYKAFFAKNDPYLVEFETIQDTFTRSDTVVFVLVPQDKDMFSRQALEGTRWLTEQAWKLPYSLRVDSLSNFQHTRVSGDDLVVKDLVPAEFKWDEAEARRLKNYALNEVMLRNRLVNENGDASVMVVTLQMPADQTKALPELMDGSGGVHALMDKFRKAYPGMDIHVTGVAVTNYYLGDVASKDTAKLFPLLMLVVLGLVGIMTKSFSNTVITLLVIAASVAVTLGGAVRLGMELDNISAISPLVIMTLTVAESVHLLAYYSLRLREGNSKIDAMTKSLAENLRPVFFTSFTTAVGFLGMSTMDSPPFIKFGYLACAGVMVAWVFGHTMLPQLAIWMARAHKGEPEVHDDKFHAAAIEWVIINPKKVFWSTMIVSIVLSICMLLNDLNDDNIGYFGKKVPLRVATEIAQDHGFGMNPIDYPLRTGEDYGITDVEYLKTVDAFVAWLKQQPEVVTASAFTDVLKRLNQNLNGDDPAQYRIPESRELASQYLLMYEMSLPQGMDLNNQIDTKKSMLRVTVFTRMLKAKQNIAFNQRAEDWLAAHLPGQKTTGIGPTIMFSHIGQTNIHGCVSGTLASIAIICACMIFGFGSIKLGVLALLPNLFPSAIMLGLWGIFNGEVNMGVAVIFTITAGIIVDDTIHLFTKFADGLRKGYDVDDSIRYSFEQAGHGVMITTIVLAAGFVMLMLSDFVVNNTLGLMMSGTILIAVLFDSLFLPSVLKVFPIDPAKFHRQDQQA